ncbi:hypothetical protein BE04_13285 [Sorangium cellulosum]|uniref:Uncharacterized protein n=1 Tax=Sorangium cellulosum TaxID=56 RepID=A0A150PTE0_SORCE|nr:hypothetical protein BE04_13285 [Sorangium cellulosum]
MAGAFRDYAVLKLGDVCPNGSTSFQRYLDTADDMKMDAIEMTPNTTIENPNIRSYHQARTGTNLEFCFFRSGTAAAMTKFPNFAQLAYGVFARTLPGSRQNGWIKIHEEEDNNLSSNTYAADCTTANGCAWGIHDMVMDTTSDADVTRFHLMQAYPNP